MLIFVSYLTLATLILYKHIYMYHLIIMSMAVFTLEMDLICLRRVIRQIVCIRLDNTCTSKLHNLQVACLIVSKRPVYLPFLIKYVVNFFPKQHG